MAESLSGDIFRDSSAVEQSPVKRLVAGSNPAPGARKIPRVRGGFCGRREHNSNLLTFPIKRLNFDRKDDVSLHPQTTRSKD